MIIKRHNSTQEHPRARHLPTCQSPKNFPGSTAYPPKPMESTFRPLLDQHTPAAVVYSDNTSLHCEPLQPHLSCVSPWIRQYTANSKLVWPGHWSTLRQCTTNSWKENTKNLHVLRQPLDKAVYCKLQVSMTWALEHSDKAVTATSEQAFSVGNTKTIKINQPEDPWTLKTHHSTSWGINRT